MEGESVVDEKQPLAEAFTPPEMNCIDEIFSSANGDASSVRWVKREELDGDINLFKNMVPSGPLEDSEDGKSWFIARVPYIVSILKSFSNPSLIVGFVILPGWQT